MAHRLKLLIAYDGAHFAGWQSQKSGDAVQDHLERAFRKVAGKPLRVHGAGRTDAGVHALAQCAHVDVDNDRLAPERWIAALNACLPPSLRVLGCKRVPNDFHARFSAVGKVYRYRIWSGPVLPPLEFGRVWHFSQNLDVELMKTATRCFAGRHDFAGFAANRGHRELTTERTIFKASVRHQGFHWTLEFDGDGFLYKMVRLMVGAITDCALGKLSLENLRNRLSAGQVKGNRLAAPAMGLYLVRVRY